MLSKGPEDNYMDDFKVRILPVDCISKYVKDSTSIIILISAVSVN